MLIKVAGFVLLAFISIAAHATVATSAGVFGTGFDPQSDGGPGVPEAYATGAGAVSLGDYWQGAHAEVLASASAGASILGLTGTVSATDHAVSNGFAGGDGDYVDMVAIHPGTSGLTSGDPVELLVQVRLTGYVELHGSPNGITSVQYQVRPGGLGPAVNYWTGNLLPPQELEVDESWQFIIGAEVGDSVPLDVNITGDLNGSGFVSGTGGQNFLVFDGIVRFLPAPGFEGIELESEAGAPTGPVPTAGDEDADGVDDTIDNCLGVANAGQRDTDGDNIGNACDPDLSGDCVVNFTDLGIIRSAFFSANADADLDGDGVVNFTDLGIMKQWFFERPGPSALINPCEPGTHAAGVIALTAGDEFDLDAGVVTAAGSPAADFSWNVDAAPAHVYFTPLADAQLDDYGPSEPDYADCRTAPLSGEPVPFWVLNTGIALCARTGDGRYARVAIITANAVPLQSATTMEIAFETWN